ncbi:MAG TPA: ABC transporter ATP-binding protein [Bacteroidales bacterium]|nr:ABC transporter ATP-binding protein [Bacteroidales bacterium]HCI54594.1 hypothetical protein [Bacteroidales bacterium]HOU96427.1 ABC transporter ATP-binding protein [Bacteroidales bacterium]HQG37316.1 ABC transporter ATP-binding protein [Bacteroidales bacterium]HQG53117.1 ABC transporter ATP-binding protein [Bacteroidales bacterium]
MEEVINFNKVVKKYGRILALDDLTFSINKGESVALIGNNGCGKTTTINVLCNLITYDKGNVMVFNRKVSPHYVTYKNKLGILLSPPIFVNEFTPLQYLKFICKFQKVEPQEISIRVNDLINVFKISYYDRKRIEDFSAGEKMKIALAAAIIHNPDVLVFDEPFVHIDIQTIDVLIELIKSIKNKKTLFITSHNLDLVTNLCNRFLIMKDGKIIGDFLSDEASSIDEIKNQIKEKIIKSKITDKNLSWFV